MRSTQHRLKLWVPLSALLLTALNPRHDNPRSLANFSPTPPDAISAQVKQDVLDSLAALKTAPTFLSWRTSGFLPSDVIGNALSLHRPQAAAALCDTLDTLGAQDLSVYESALKSLKTRQKLSCTGPLLAKMQEYWISETDAADGERERADKESSPLSVVKQSLPPQSAKIDSSLLGAGDFALVIEGAIDPILTREIVSALSDRSVSALFLVNGHSARDYPDVAEMITHARNSLGSASAQSVDLAMLSVKDAEKEIVDGEHSVDIASGMTSSFFGFPLGSSSDTLQAFVAQQGLRVVRADLDSKDWKIFSVPALVRSVRQQIAQYKKGVLQLHGDMRQTAIALPQILDTIAENHGRLVTFDPTQEGPRRDPGMAHH